MAETIPIDRISTEGTQTRAELNDTVIDEYAEAYEQGIELPPIDVYYDEKSYWISDGFHRLRAAQQIGRDSIAANVHPGGQREAIFHAVGANETHGLRRTNADRRNAVCIMLQDPEWSQWSDRDLAERCMVSHTFVNRLRHEMSQAKQQPVKEEKRKYQRAGRTQTMRTENIGAGKRRPQAEPQQAIEVEQAAEALTVNRLQLDAESAATMEPERPPASKVSSVTEAAVAAPLQEPPTETVPVTSPSTEPDMLKVVDEAMPIPAELEYRPDEALRDTTAVGHLTFDPNASTIPEVVLEALTLDRRWDLATSAEQREFVTQHRGELQRLLTRLQRRAAASS